MSPKNQLVMRGKYYQTREVYNDANYTPALHVQTGNMQQGMVQQGHQAFLQLLAHSQST